MLTSHQESGEGRQDAEEAGPANERRAAGRTQPIEDLVPQFGAEQVYGELDCKCSRCPQPTCGVMI